MCHRVATSHEQYKPAITHAPRVQTPWAYTQRNSGVVAQTHLHSGRWRFCTPLSSLFLGTQVVFPTTLCLLPFMQWPNWLRAAVKCCHSVRRRFSMLLQNDVQLFCFHCILWTYRLSIHGLESFYCCHSGLWYFRVPLSPLFLGTQVITTLCLLPFMYRPNWLRATFSRLICEPLVHFFSEIRTWNLPADPGNWTPAHHFPNCSVTACQCVTESPLQWQQFWNSCTGNKLQAIRPTVSGHQPKSSLSRRDEVVINRLTRCTHSYLLTGEDKPECTTCQCPLTVKHILVDCFNFNDTRNKYFIASSMEELFRTADVHNILDFIKETYFYSKLWCLQTFLY